MNYVIIHVGHIKFYIYIYMFRSLTLFTLNLFLFKVPMGCFFKVCNLDPASVQGFNIEQVHGQWISRHETIRKKHSGSSRLGIGCNPRFHHCVTPGGIVHFASRGNSACWSCILAHLSHR